jgi:hypothetical protein
MILDQDLGFEYGFLGSFGFGGDKNKEEKEMEIN